MWHLHSGDKERRSFEWGEKHQCGVAWILEIAEKSEIGQVAI